MAVPRFMAITIDATDPGRLADFWTALLGTEVETEFGDGRYVLLVAGDGIPQLCLQRVPEAKTIKNRVHIDLEVDDLDAATERVRELGGSWPDGQQRTLDRDTWRTLADPEGNEFDVILEA